MSLPTVPTSGTTRKTDKQKTDSANIKEIYRHEINRLRSFSGWPGFASAAPTLLAKAGFFYTATGDTVECFICRVRINQWKISDDPIKEHQINSPGCIFIHGGESGNVPLIPGNDNEDVKKMDETRPVTVLPIHRSSELSPTSAATAKIERQIEEKLKAISQYPNSIESESARDKLKLMHNIPQKSSIPEKNEVWNPRLEAGNKTPDEEEPVLNLTTNQVGNTSQMGSLYRGGAEPSELFPQEPDKNPVFERHGREQRQQPVIPEDPHVTFGTTIWSQPVGTTASDAVPYRDETRALTIAQVQAMLRSGVPFTHGATERCAVDDLIQLVPTATSPDYALIEKRMDSFISFRYSHKVDSKKLAEAGFFYTGADDRVRCFQCNGGLCNWEREDIPWYEHYRWFGLCQYLLKAAKNEVVKVTITTAKHIHGARAAIERTHHHHHHGSGRTQCDPALVEDLWRTDNMKKLLSMGFSRNKIQAVIDKKGVYIINDLENIIDALDKPSPTRATVFNRTPPGLTSPVQSQFRRSVVQTSQNEEMISAHLCQICRQSKVALMFLPCRHLVSCISCGIVQEKCLFCHKKVQATSKVEVK